MERRGKYSEEYKHDALVLTEKIGVMQTAKDLGIDKSMLYQWRKAAAKAAVDGLPAFPGQGNARDEELYRLRKRVSELERANDILKKAAVIFAEGTPR
jgi:transposase-like protein